MKLVTATPSHIERYDRGVNTAYATKLGRDWVVGKVGGCEIPRGWTTEPAARKALRALRITQKDVDFAAYLASLDS